MNRGFLQRPLVHAHLHNLCNLLGRQTSGQIGCELLFEQRDSFLTSAAVADRVLYLNLFRMAPILEEDLNGIGDRAFVRIEIISGITRVFHSSGHEIPIEVLRSIRTEKIPCDVILITAAKEIEIIEEAFRLGIFDSLIKAF